MMATTENQFTPTQTRLMAVLGDGMPHPVAQLFACLDDELSGVQNLRNHLSVLRKILRRESRDILCNESGTTSYRLVKLVYDDE